MRNASLLLNELKIKHLNMDFDWERLLYQNYKTILEGKFPVCIDIGCHKGLHTDHLLSDLQASEVYIFEPIKDLFDHLAIKYQNNTNVYCYNLNESGEADFVHNESSPGESGLKERTFYSTENNSLRTFKVNVKRLDEIAIESKIDYIKIDCEGAELNILKGALQLIAKSRPVISVEYGVGGYDSYGYKSEDLFIFCDRINYAIFDLFGNKFTSLEEWLDCVSVFYWDYILVPDEISEDIQIKFKKNPILVKDFLLKK